MTVLITGASGFIGKALLKHMEDNKFNEEHDIILYSAKDNNNYRCINHKGYIATKNDFIENGIEHIDVLIHMGASVPKRSVEFGVENTFKFSQNVTNTEWLLRHLPSVPNKIVFISTVSVYENVEKIDERTAYQISDMYGASKLMCEAIITEYAKKHKSTLHILRLGQIYGEGEESYNKIVSYFTKQILLGNEITVLGDGNSVRSMLYVKDCAAYISSAIQLQESTPTVNIAAGKAISINEIIHIIEKCTGRQANLHYNKNGVNRSDYYDVTLRDKLFPNIRETDYTDGIGNFCGYYIDKYKEKGVKSSGSK